MDITTLYKEKSLLNHQFPTVTATNDPPTRFEGLIRCEKGEVKHLAEQRVWPFTEYADWNRFRLDISSEYPLKPPVATWLTEISHPNIVPNVPNAVCVSILGDKWDPRLKLISVVNALHYLLTDPNPQNVFDHPRSLKAATVCRTHGFPKMAKVKKSESQANDTVRFNIVPIPRLVAPRPTPSDVIRFRIPGRDDRASR
ncbi:MAG TPA: ubiquitin-conjugating enzyme E2 [Methylomirabilota bacterium]|nr:ubiquitin-conjugating enzyme E2 [Methylomirabilota bacterium]